MLGFRKGGDTGEYSYQGVHWEFRLSGLLLRNLN